MGSTEIWHPFPTLSILDGEELTSFQKRSVKPIPNRPGARTKADKEIMKVDERVNILYMIYTGDFLKIFPLNDGQPQLGIAARKHLRRQ